MNKKSKIILAASLAIIAFMIGKAVMGFFPLISN